MTALLLLAMIGQTCPPGTYCPTPGPAYYATTPAAPAWQWYQLTINGRQVVVPAYQSGGIIYYDSTRLPPDEITAAGRAQAFRAMQDAAPKPAPEPTPAPKPETPMPSGDPLPAIGNATAGPLNYGLDMDAIASELAGDRNVIQTNDPALGSLLTGDTTESRLFKPEVKVNVPDLTRPILIGFAVIAAAILLTTRRPRS
jgi:hypothetical protein